VFQGKIEDTAQVSPDKSHRGEAVWMDYELLRADEFMPGFIAIKQLLASTDGFFFDEVKEEF
jgi:hypothetical protein